MPKGEKSYLHVFPFGFELISIWIWSGHKLLSFACLCPIVELLLDYLLLCVELCAILCVY
jgi:hypothetical protein